MTQRRKKVPCLQEAQLLLRFAGPCDSGIYCQSFKEKALSKVVSSRFYDCYLPVRGEN